MFSKKIVSGPLAPPVPAIDAALADILLGSGVTVTVPSVADAPTDLGGDKAKFLNYGATCLKGTPAVDNDANFMVQQKLLLANTISHLGGTIALGSMDPSAALAEIAKVCAGATAATPVYFITGWEVLTENAELTALIRPSTLDNTDVKSAAYGATQLKFNGTLLG